MTLAAATGTFDDDSSWEDSSGDDEEPDVIYPPSTEAGEICSVPSEPPSRVASHAGSDDEWWSDNEEEVAVELMQDTSTITSNSRDVPPKPTLRQESADEAEDISDDEWEADSDEERPKPPEEVAEVEDQQEELEVKGEEPQQSPSKDSDNQQDSFQTAGEEIPASGNKDAKSSDSSNSSRMNLINRVLDADSDEESNSGNENSPTIDRVKRGSEEDRDLSSNLGWGSEEDEEPPPTRTTDLEMNASSQRIEASRFESRISHLQVDDDDIERAEERPSNRSGSPNTKSAAAKAETMATIYLYVGICFVVLGLSCAIAAILLRDVGRT